MLMFSTDYPHHQFDDPGRAAPEGLSGDALAKFLGRTALDLYRLDEG
jgi:predicted TIM-barrel fold metal-dependent hydrolase